MIPRGLYEVKATSPKVGEDTGYRNEEGAIDPYFHESEDEEAGEWPKVDLGGFPTGVDLIGVCLRVVWKDKEILAYQAASITICLSVLALFLHAILQSTDMETLTTEGYEIVILAQLFPFYIIASFVGSYFLAATVTVATIRMKGGNPTFADGIEAATKKLPSILGWAIITAIVGWVLALLRSRKRGARLAADIGQLAWGIATYFVVPVMLFENKGPVAAISRSKSIVWRTWKESLAGNFGMGLVFFGLILGGLLVFFPVGYAISGFVGGVVGVAIWVMVVLVFSSAASGVLVAALYRLARTGKMPAEMDGYSEFGGALRRFKRNSPAGDVYGLSEDMGMTADQLTQKYAR